MRSGFVLLSMIGLVAAARVPVLKREEPPSCADDCFANIPNTPGLCNPSDTQCLCTSAQTNSFLRSCLSASCPTSQIEAANQYFQYVCQNGGSFGSGGSSSSPASSSAAASSSTEASSAGTSSSAVPASSSPAPAPSPSPSSASPAVSSTSQAGASSAAAPSSSSASSSSKTSDAASSAAAQTSQTPQSSAAAVSSSPSVVVVTSTAVVGESSTPSVVIATSTNFVTPGVASNGGSGASQSANGQSLSPAEASAAGTLNNSAGSASQVKIGLLGFMAAAAGLLVVA